MQPFIRVIGIGSPFGEDQIGWLVADALQQSDILQPYFEERLQIIQSDRPGVGLLTEMEGVDVAILVDAAVSEGMENNVRFMTIDEVMSDSPLVSSHGFGVQQALVLGRSLGQLPHEIIVVAISISAPSEPNLSENLEGLDVSEMSNRVEQLVISRLNC